MIDGGEECAEPWDYGRCQWNPKAGAVFVAKLVEAFMEWQLSVNRPSQRHWKAPEEELILMVPLIQNQVQVQVDG